MNVLLEEDGAETRVESANTLVLEDLAETTNQAVGETRCGDKTNAGRLKRTQGNRGEELSGGGGDGIHHTTVLPSLLNAEDIDRLLLEELITAELECTLDEVTSEGWAEASQERTGTLILDDLAETADHAAVVGGRVQLNLRLDARCQVSAGDNAKRRASRCRWTGVASIHIDRGKATVRDGAAQGTSKSEARVEVSALGGLLAYNSRGSHCVASDE